MKNFESVSVNNSTINSFVHVIALVMQSHWRVTLNAAHVEPETPIIVHVAILVLGVLCRHRRDSWVACGGGGRGAMWSPIGAFVTVFGRSLPLIHIVVPTVPKKNVQRG